MVPYQRKSDTSFTNVQSWLEGLATTFPTAEADVIRRACKLAEPLYDGQVEFRQMEEARY